MLAIVPSDVTAVVGSAASSTEISTQPSVVALFRSLGFQVLFCAVQNDKVLKLKRSHSGVIVSSGLLYKPGSGTLQSTWRQFHVHVYINILLLFRWITMVILLSPGDQENVLKKNDFSFDINIMFMIANFCP